MGHEAHRAPAFNHDLKRRREEIELDALGLALVDFMGGGRHSGLVRRYIITTSAAPSRRAARAASAAVKPPPTTTTRLPS